MRLTPYWDVTFLTQIVPSYSFTITKQAICVSVLQMCSCKQEALLALHIPTEDVTPNKWEKTYQLGSSGKYTKTEWKNRLKAKAQQMFPHLGKKVTLATCDALLICEYGRRQNL